MYGECGALYPTLNVYTIQRPNISITISTLINVNQHLLTYIVARGMTKMPAKI